MSSEEFIVTLKRSRADFFDMLRLVAPQMWGWWRPLWNCGVLPIAAYAIGIGAGYFILSRVGGVTQNNWPDARNAVVVAALCSGSSLLLLSIASNAFLKPKVITPEGEFLATATAHFNGGGVSIKREKVNKDYKWSAFHKVKTSKRGYMILTDVADGIYVPRASFESQEQADSFEAFVVRKIDGNT